MMPSIMRFLQRFQSLAKTGLLLYSTLLKSNKTLNVVSLTSSSSLDTLTRSSLVVILLTG
ncbi:unnamed protein product [Eruca vesicaria subsp. sativa]|uniref:Uncharacterized protein n=1 Tax=Eruca vesicaria subsp. sativa TaxID=29727 RepID=A0ABC8KKS0_ERUVS|nr:unnamed protein product [Eruca vesicaria subsp. sativa]